MKETESKRIKMVHQRKALIAPSLLSCDLANIASEAENMIRLGADWLHMDIMVRKFELTSLMELTSIRMDTLYQI